MSAASYIRLPDHTDSDDGLSLAIEHQLHQSLLSPHVSPLAQDSHHEFTDANRSSQSSANLQPSLLSRQLQSSRQNRTAKKGRRVKWVTLTKNGEKRVIEADKRSLIQMMGLEIPIRDMRLLDASVPTFETVAQVLVRENALVCSMEHVRLIITADKALVPLDGDRVQQTEKFAALLELGLRDRNHEECDRHTDGEDAKPYSYPEQLPFELHVLELALGEICRQIAGEAASLEAQAHPVLEDLTRNPDTKNLERVRKVKTVHQRLVGRVKAMREMLEKYLEDDNDMYRMCLTRRKEVEAEGGAGEQHMILQRLASARRPIPHSAIPPSPMALSALSHSHSLSYGLPQQFPQPNGDAPVMSDATSEYHDLLEVENLLESYFAMANSTYFKLLALGEYIDDTEDYINIELDWSRNRLIRFEILLTTATFALAFFAVIAGILGENVPIPDLFTKGGFWSINFITLVFCIVVFVGVINILSRRKLV